MKQKFLYLAIATLVMASCSQDETININEGKGIGFRAEANAGTRATVITDNNLSDFWVTAVYQTSGDSYFSDVKFSETQGGYYQSTPSYNWPGSEGLSFFAIHPSKTDLGGTFTLDKDNQKVTSFSVKENITDQKDFIYATANGSKDNEETGVKLTFKHMLSQIEVKAKNTNDTYIYKVKGVRIGEIPSTADLVLSPTVTWSNFSNKLTFSDMCNETILSNDAVSIMNTTAGNAMLIPQQTLTPWAPATDKSNSNQGAYLGVYLQITTQDGNTIYPRNTDTEYGYACIPFPNKTKWQEGQHYIYTLDFSNGAGYVDPTITPEGNEPDQPGDPILGGAIKFTVEVNAWQPAEGGQNTDVSMQ